jgi:hypothetical protein
MSMSYNTFGQNLDLCDPLKIPDAESMEIARNWVERRRVMQFLKGLNKGWRADMLHYYI